MALQNAASTFCLPMLDSIVKNLQTGGKFLNPSIGTYLNDQTGQRAKWLFLNKLVLSDVRFKVEGRLCAVSLLSCSSGYPWLSVKKLFLMELEFDVLGAALSVPSTVYPISLISLQN